MRPLTLLPARLRPCLAGIAALVVLAGLPCATASAVSDTTQFSVTAGSLAFGISPDVPNLPALTLNGQVQTLNAQMNSYSVSDGTGAGAGWNVTVNGDSAGGKSAVFKQYCPNATCGTDSGPAYITGGRTLAASSLTLNSTSATWTGNSGTLPSHLCNASCFMDTTTAVKIASATTSVSLGTWSTTGYSATSQAVSIPTTTRFLSQAGEIYRIDLVFTLNSGP